MRRVTLVRVERDQLTTVGVITTDTMYQCWSLEPAWVDNALNISCIPAGSYECVWTTSSRFGKVYHVLDVPYRTGIEIHPGNYHTDTQGCILLGRALVKYMGKCPQLQESQMALMEFAQAMGNETFNLTISGAFEGSQPTSPTVPATR
jgi:hypothetical protein